MAAKIFLKRVLIPLWTAQILISVILIVASAFAIFAFGEAAANGDFDGLDASQTIAAFNIAAAISLALSLLTLIFDLIEVLLFFRNRLRPVSNLVLQCIKSLIWTVWFFLTVVAAARGAQDPLGIFLALVMFLTSIGQLIYGSIIVHRHRKGTLDRGKYALAEGGQLNPQSQAFVPEEPVYTAYNPQQRGHSIDYEDSAKPYRSGGVGTGNVPEFAVFEMKSTEPKY